MDSSAQRSRTVALCFAQAVVKGSIGLTFGGMSGFYGMTSGDHDFQDLFFGLFLLSIITTFVAVLVCVSDYYGKRVLWDQENEKKVRETVEMEA